ncbi:MAG: hypothetical protein IKV90_01835 [Clostridia bacterium]|nr:hypothetical protein [Clostridia bacterium]
MAASDSIPAASECELLLDLLSRHKYAQKIRPILLDAQDIRRMMHLYSFRSPRQTEALCTALASRYREAQLALYGIASLPPRQSSSVYLRLEQLLSLIARAALLHLSLSGDLPFSNTQLTQSDGMLLHLLKREMQKTGG